MSHMNIFFQLFKIILFLKLQNILVHKSYNYINKLYKNPNYQKLKYIKYATEVFNKKN